MVFGGRLWAMSCTCAAVTPWGRDLENSSPLRRPQRVGSTHGGDLPAADVQLVQESSNRLGQAAARQTEPGAGGGERGDR